ncbi:MAG: dTDP-4-dehydrorhamnose 3,5-epimerase [Betaproteobacteria bacterium ADurb.Bin341]|nr:MAG: dTDP-4-dehydrorhamnose 3,5-epimerase [Betaproteobacteria bacterium ADurb.Bin341]
MELPVPHFEFLATPLLGLKVVRRRRIEDDRGYLSRMFCAAEFEGLGLDKPVQINRTLTRRQGAVRGMHFQHPPHAETKLISCLKGKVFDVAVDLRAGSPTFLCWHAEELSEENQRSLLIPAGFAHGFQTLSDDCELLYLHSNFYAPDVEGGLNPADPRLGINWPLTISEMSARDCGHSYLGADFSGIEL